jgi:glycosyltransferase involved in cell wall biosynthesis
MVYQSGAVNVRRVATRVPPFSAAYLTACVTSELDYMRVGILTQYYLPEMGAPPARLSELAAHLRKHGHDVIVLCAMPNYPQGRVYPGYGGFVVQEQRDGVDVVRSWIWPTKSKAFAPRTFSYLSFVASSLMVGALRLPRLDLLITESPPLLLGGSGYLLSRLKRARWVFNVSDLWPESAIELSVLGNGTATKLAYALEAFCYRRAWRVSCQSDEIRSSIDERFPEARTLGFFNGVDTERFSPAHRSDEVRRGLAGDSDVVALYAGLHGIAQGLDQVLAAAGNLRHENFRLVLIGDGPEKDALLKGAEARELRNVTFLPPQSRDEIPAFLASADLAVVPLAKRLRGAVPSKLYEAMASGLPVVLVAEGEPAEIVRSTCSGIVVPPGDIAGLTAAFRRLVNSGEERFRLGSAGRAAALERFDRRRLCEGFINALQQ